MKKSGKGKKILIVVGAIVLALAIVLIVEHEAVRGVFYSNYDPLNKLDVEGEWSGGETYKNVQFSDVSENDYLNLYVPDTEQPAPLIVLVHGGGFVMNDCESRQAQLFYQYFRDHGYACATVNYRLAQEAKFPAALEDVKAAIRFLRANAENYGYNADKLVIWGESAGGYLAVMAGSTTDEEFNSLPFIGEEELAEPVSARVSAIVDFYGVMELETREERKAAFKELGILGFIVNLSNLWLTNSLKDVPDADNVEEFWTGVDMDTATEEEKQQFLPAYYIQKNLGADSDLRVFIRHGDADITVPWPQSQRVYELFSEKLGEDRVEIEYIHNAKHAGEKIYTDEVLGALKQKLDAVTGA